jgi:hypothetical protein
MRTRLHNLRPELIGILLLWGLPAYYPLWIAHEWLDVRLANHPGYPGKVWRLVHNSKWQQSSALSSTTYAVNFALVYVGVSYLGHGWVFNTLASLVWDAVFFLVKKFKIWGDRDACCSTSAVIAVALWALFFSFNFSFTYLLFDQTDMGVAWVKIAMIPMGLLLNPVRFWLDDRLAFTPQLTVRDALGHSRRVVR